MFHLWDTLPNKSMVDFYCNYSRNTVCKPHVNYSCEFLIVLSGSVKVTIHQTEYFVKDNQIIFVNSMYPHFFETLSDSSNCLIIGFSPLFLEDFCSTLYKKSLTREVTTLSKTHIKFIRELIKKRKVTYPGNTDDINTILYSLKNEILFENKLVPNKNKNDSLAIMRAIDYISEHYSENISLGDLSKKLSLNKTYTSQIFPKYLGLTFRDTLDSIRLKYATKFLKSTEQSISDIAFSCGFESIRTFNRIFKKHFGITPSQFRKSTSLSFIPDDRLDFPPTENSFQFI